MKDKLRKKYQRAFNKEIRALNKSFLEDELWRGRFIFLQRDVHFCKFFDNSGGVFTVSVRGYDKKTGYYKDYKVDFAPWSKYTRSKIFEAVDRFIEDCGVWRENPRPSITTAADYTKEKVCVEELMKKDWNFYMNFRGEQNGL